MWSAVAEEALISRLRRVSAALRVPHPEEWVLLLDMFCSFMDKNDWKVGDAKQRFSEVLRRSEKEPQLIYRRDKLVAAVISVNHERDVPGRERRTIADRFAEARERFAEDLDSFSPPKRRSRKNPFTDVLDDLAG